MFGFWESVSAFARSGKFLRSRTKGFDSSSGSGCGRTPVERCWSHLCWWGRGSANSFGLGSVGARDDVNV